MSAGTLANLNSEIVAKIQQLENEIISENGRKLILLAYDKE